MKKHSLDFGKKERVLNYACQTYQLSRPNKVGAVMALIRECQPNSFEEWEQWYFLNAHTSGKKPTKITNESLRELGERLYAKITEIVIPEWESAFRECDIETITLPKCIFIGDRAFQDNKNFHTLILPTNYFTTLDSDLAFKGTALWDYAINGKWDDDKHPKPTIQVHPNLLDDYRSGTNWSVFADCIIAYSE